MLLTLSLDDRRAVDVVMDRALHQASPVWGNRVHESSFNLQRRVDRVNALIQLLSLMPAPEPSDDLLQRTLDHIHAAGTMQPTTMPIAFAHLGGH